VEITPRSLPRTRGEETSRLLDNDLAMLIDFFATQQDAFRVSVGPGWSWRALGRFWPGWARRSAPRRPGPILPPEKPGPRRVAFPTLAS